MPKSKYTCDVTEHLPSNPEHNLECVTKDPYNEKITIKMKVDKNGAGIVTEGQKRYPRLLEGKKVKVEESKITGKTTIKVQD